MSHALLCTLTAKTVITHLDDNPLVWHVVFNLLQPTSVRRRCPRYGARGVELVIGPIRENQKNLRPGITLPLRYDNAFDLFADDIL